MLRRVAKSLTVVSVLSALLTLLPINANAIPVAGDYQFNSGLSGTFTSNGSSLSAWDMHFGTAQFLSTSDHVFSNNVSTFDTESFISFAGLDIDWTTNKFIFVKPGNPNVNGTVSFSTVSSVPEPTSGLLVLTGIFGLVGYHNWRLRKQSEVLAA